jgi:hypothetical protein
LLVAVAAEHADDLDARFARQGVVAARVGRVTDAGCGRILCQRG